MVYVYDREIYDAKPKVVVKHPMLVMLVVQVNEIYMALAN